jgi:hypothetical protein
MGESIYKYHYGNNSMPVQASLVRSYTNNDPVKFLH